MTIIKKMFDNRASFTLVELLVVVAVLALLASIVFSNLTGAREQAKISNALSFQSQIQSLLGSDLIGRWSFNEGTGTVAYDSSGYGNNGVLKNFNFSDSSGWSNDTPSPGGYSLKFDGSNDYVDCGNVGNYQEITLSAWIKPTDNGTSNGRDFLTKYYSSSPPYISYGAELNENNNVVFQIMDDEKYIRAVSKERLSKGNWHHIAITISNNSLKGYINGVENVSFNRTTEIQFNEEEGIFKIGAWGTESNSFKGFIDEICMYNTFFSSIKVKALYYSGLKSLLAKGLIIENEYQERLKIK